MHGADLTEFRTLISFVNIELGPDTATIQALHSHVCERAKQARATPRLALEPKAPPHPNCPNWR